MTQQTEQAGVADSVGRYTLAGIRTRVWQKLDSLRYDNIDAKGNVTNPGDDFVIDPLYPKPIVDSKINSVLTGIYIDLTLNGELPFADEAPIDINADQTEYELPFDMMSLRGLYWKWPEDPRKVVPINDRVYMFNLDAPNHDGSINNGAPRYRLQLNNFVLESPPKKPNPSGVMVRYVKWINWLSQDEQVIESQFARLIQEVVIIDSAIQLAQDQAQIDVSAWKTDLQTWQQRLGLATRNYNMPPFTIMYYPHPLKLRTVV